MILQLRQSNSDVGGCGDGWTGEVMNAIRTIDASVTNTCSRQDYFHGEKLEDSGNTVQSEVANGR